MAAFSFAQRLMIPFVLLAAYLSNYWQVLLLAF
jgi:hypothetical protein